MTRKRVCDILKTTFIFKYMLDTGIHAWKLGGLIRLVKLPRAIAQIMKTQTRAIDSLEIGSTPKWTIQDAMSILKIDETWNANVRESNWGPNWGSNLNYSHIAECLLSSTTNFMQCMGDFNSNLWWAATIVYGGIIDGRVIKAAEESQNQFKKRAVRDEGDLLHPNISASKILEHLWKLKNHFSYNQIVRLLKIYGFSEEKNPLQ